MKTEEKNGRFSLTWSKVSPTDKYLKIPNSTITELASNANALALLMVILTSRNDYFKSKNEIYERLGWNKNSNLYWLNAIEFLQSKGYAKKIKRGCYEFSNAPVFEKVVKYVIPEQPENSSFTKEEWIEYHTAKIKEKKENNLRNQPADIDVQHIVNKIDAYIVDARASANDEAIDYINSNIPEDLPF